MSRKLFSLIACLVLVLNFGVVPGAAQEDEGGEFVIRPASIQPPDGSVDIYVPLGDNVIIRTGWGACTRGLAQAWTNQNEISLWVNGEPVFSSLRESKSFWGEPESFLLPDGSSCINDKDSGWRVYWEYPLGELAEGTYNIHYEENVDHPFLDGGDYDGDGKPDIDEWHISVDFNIIVTEMGSISGTVTEEGSGEPIEGIFVFACEVDVHCDTTHTDSNGFYKISLPIGTYKVGTYTETDYISEFYDDKIYWEEADDVLVIAGEETANINFALLPAGTISGRVTSEYGDPLPGLWVDACEYDNQSYCGGAETDDDGYYSILLPPGEYWVQVSVEQDWIGQVYDVDPQDGVPDRVAVIVGEDTAGIDFELLAAGMISGRVTSEYGDPLAGLWVDACEYDNQSYCGGAETDDDGYYSILLPPGEYWVQVWVEQDWIGQVYDVDPQDGVPDRVAVIVGEDTAGIDFELLAAGTISGRVTSEYGDPLAGLWVDACEYDNQSYCGSAETDDDGYYSILLPPGEYWVQIFPETDWIGKVYDVDPQDGVPDRVAVMVGEDTAGIDFELLAAGMISGTVTTVDVEGNTVPVTELWVDACHESVSLEMWGNSPLCNGAQTDQDGFYTIPRLLPGNYRVVTWGNDIYVHQFFDHQLSYNEAELVDVEGGQTAENINFDLILGGSISGWVTDDSGEPVVDGWVGSCEESVSEDEWGTSPLCNGASTDENGFYTITALQPGNYRVFISGDEAYLPQFFDHQNDYDEANLVEVEGGQTAEDINFDLILGGSISGWVTDDSGEPVVDIWVDSCEESISEDEWGSSPLCNGASTDENGFYTITPLQPGNYRVVIWGDEAYLPQFYDGVLNYYEASLVTVEPGQMKEGVDFSLSESGPAFNAWPIENYVDGWGWDVDVPVTLTIDDPSNGEGTDYTAILSPFPGTTSVMFELQGVFDLEPGYIVTLDNGIHTKQHTVTKLAIAGADLATSSVFGTAEPGSHVYVWYYTDEGRIDRHEVAGASGGWTANFSMPGDELGEEQIYMIPAGAGGEANQVDFDGDGTQVNWWMQEP